MSATIPVPLQPPKTVSSVPLQDELTSYAPPTLTKRTGHSIHITQPPYKMDTPDRVKRIMDSVKQKLDNPNKLTLKQFNRQLKATTPSLTASFPFHPTITKNIKKSLASHDVKVTSSSGPTYQNEDHTSSSPHSDRRTDP